MGSIDVKRSLTDTLPVHSVFFKVELLCNGLIPVRIASSSLKPSKIYDVASFSVVESRNLVSEDGMLRVATAGDSP